MSSFIFKNMASLQLPNYLRANRKRLALSQKEVAYLLGSESGAKVSRYEQFARSPSLETALAYEAIFQKPIRELFAGLYEKIEQQVGTRAKALAGRMDYSKSNQATARKLRIFVDLADRHSKKANRP
jgi:transcriptional regulator with XRE-family HTH domain